MFRIVYTDDLMQYILYNTSRDIEQLQILYIYQLSTEWNVQYIYIYIYIYRTLPSRLVFVQREDILQLLYHQSIFYSRRWGYFDIILYNIGIHYQGLCNPGDTGCPHSKPIL